MIPAPCPTCKQTGQVRIGGTKYEPEQQPCPYCGGIGWIPQLENFFERLITDQGER